MATKELAFGQLTHKDMTVLRETEGVRTAYKKTSGVIKEYGLNHTIGLTWGLEESRKGLLPFYLRIDDKRFALSWGELRDMDRAGFFRREEGNPRFYHLKYLDGPELTFDVDLNEEAERDTIFRITGKNIEAYCDWQEFLKLGRYI
jgi:hypothetical protein